MISRPATPDMPGGSIDVEEAADGAVLHLRGDVDAPLVDGWRSMHADPGADFVAVDVSELAYIDSSGLSFLVRWAEEVAAAGRPAVVRRPTSRFRQVLDVAGLSDLFLQES